jgi:hypothetical protein
MNDIDCLKNEKIIITDYFKTDNLVTDLQKKNELIK